MKTYDKNRQYHSYNDQPAIIWADGSQFWYQHGQLHRDNDQPAIIWADGIKTWYQHGELIKAEFKIESKPKFNWIIEGF